MPKAVPGHSLAGSLLRRPYPRQGSGFWCAYEFRRHKGAGAATTNSTSMASKSWTPSTPTLQRILERGQRPAIGEVHPDLDASAILMRATSIKPRMAVSCDRSQDSPACSRYLRISEDARGGAAQSAAPGDSLISAPAIQFRNGFGTVPIR